MHAYATDARDRERIPIWLAIASVIAALFLHTTLGTFNLDIPWWVESPSVMGFYGLFHIWFDNVGWHLRVAGIRLSSIPDIRGTWVGSIKSSYQDGGQTQAVIYIRQTWMRLIVRLETETSRSVSTMAALNTYEAAESGLKYEYLNEPGNFSVPTMQIHRGTTHLQISPDETILEGDYYTGRGRQNIGSMVFQRVSRGSLTRTEALRQISQLHLSDGQNEHQSVERQAIAESKTNINAA
jgi:hypothetical protein